MTKTIKSICVILGIICSLQAFLPAKSEKVLAESETIKGVWAATVFSLDYPQSPTINSASLKAQADDLVKRVEELGYNTLFFQVRPSADAFYRSEIFPWSQYLTGSPGAEPQDGFDPLLYIIDQAHKRGIAVHAWVNPYRVTASAAETDRQSAQSISAKYPQLVVKHTDGKLYLNPGEPEANKLVIDGILEIVQNYEVDGIHLDDYFYPSSAFPDGETFTKYGGDFQNIEDWRRNNVNTFMRDLSKALRSKAPKVVFSVSPCGIWANKNSNPAGSNTSGKQSYYDYYADTRLWVKEDLIDIIVPQIYWNIGNNLADFKELVRWWSDTVDGTSVKLCIGQGVYRAADETDPASVWYGESGIDELYSQLRLMNSLDHTSGYVHYRLGSVLKSDRLQSFAKEYNKNSFKIFSDTAAYPWAEPAIESLYAKGIVNGMGNRTFGCSLTVTRADFTVMLVRLTGQNVPFTENFADVTEDKYYFKEVGIAKVLGYATGREGNIFDPQGNITREDMATLAYRVLLKQGSIGDTDPDKLYKKFADANEISEYARTAVAAMTEKGYLNGFDTGEFKPKGLATRAETAVLLDRIAEDN